MDSAYAISSSLMRYVFVLLLAYIPARLVYLSIVEWKYSSKVHDKRRREVIGKITITRPIRMINMECALTGAATIGSSSTCDIRFKHKSICSKHAEIFTQGDIVLISAYKPKNFPVLINGDSIGRTNAVIEDNDRITIGRIEFEVKLSDEELDSDDDLYNNDCEEIDQSEDDLEYYGLNIDETE